MINRLKAFRFIRKMNQDQLALKAQIHRPRLSKIENGYIKPKEEEKRRLATALQADVDDLFPELGDESKE